MGPSPVFEPSGSIMYVPDSILGLDVMASKQERGKGSALASLDETLPVAWFSFSSRRANLSSRSFK